MNKRAWIGVAVITSATIAGAVTWPARSHAIVAAWAVSLMAWGLLRAVGHLRFLGEGRSEFDKALSTQAHRTARPDDLARCERLFGWSTYPARDFDHHVRPLLKELLEHRIAQATRSGNTIELGPELAALVDETEAEGSYGPNVTSEDVGRVLDRIEKL